MDEIEALDRLAKAGLLDILSWAIRSSARTTRDLYDETAGHDNAIAGSLTHKAMVDRMDRGTGNGKYRSRPQDPSGGLDFLIDGLTPTEILTRPTVRPGLVARADLNQSPGWAVEGVRVLLSSFSLGGIDKIDWAQSSPTKQLAARQIFVGAGTLFDGSDCELDLPVGVAGDEFEGVTLVAAHAYDLVTDTYELYIGQPCIPADNAGKSWHWRRSLLDQKRELSEHTPTFEPQLPGESATLSVEDVAVRLKPTTPSGPSSTER